MKDIKKMDITLFILMTVFIIFGLMMILSSSSASTVLKYGYSSSHFLVKQLIAVIAAYIVGIIILKIPTKYYKLFINIYTIMVFSFLIIVLLKGKISHNAQSWFNLGFISIQPSEFAKTAIILFMASFYNTLNSYNSNWTLYFIPVAVAIGMFLLIVLEPDLGSSLIFMGLAILCFFKVPYIQKNKKKFIKYLSIAGVMVLFFGYLNIDKILTAERKERLFEFRNPCERYQYDSGYQTCNGFIAIANGGLFGVGLGNSSQKYLYLPESHTDFIFPIICEECGVIVGIILIVVYWIILLRINRIAKQTTNVRNRIITYGTFWLLALHIFVNLLGVLALIPLTGVPLPFLSYGGSFSLNIIIMVFIVERIAIENKQERIKKQIASL